MNDEQVKKASDELNTSNINNLLQYKKGGTVAKVEILSSDNSCEHCQNQNGKIYTIEEAIKTRPLSCKECNHEMGYCLCASGGLNEKYDQGSYI